MSASAPIMWAPSFPQHFSLFTWRSQTNRLVHPLILKVRLLLLGGWNREWDRRLRRRMRDSETCCVQRGGLFHFSLTRESRLEHPCTLLLRRAWVCFCACCACAFPSIVCAHGQALTVHQLFPERPAVFPGTNYGGTCPFPPSVLEVMWLALQGRHHRYTHRSAEILPAPVGPSTAVLEKW